jgi:hypothetical protein
VFNPPGGVAPPPTAVNVAPSVDAYDELTYRCKNDDTFAGISLKFFQSEKYARALQMHNRNHPRAPEGILHDPPNLANVQVYIPPLRILEKNYGSLIPDFKPLPAMAAPPLSPPTSPGGAAPVPGGPGAFAPGTAPTAGTSLASPQPDKLYKVIGNGEMYRDIAARTLGNRDRWGEIYQLNGRRYPPEYPVPPGIVLRLPADARVDGVPGQ